ncbi:WD repeat-containing protein 18 [Blomia tropicalis]|nr:WD repeat-containing protein 18 [Blomia tropicalis]
MSRTQVAISTDNRGELFTITIWDVMTGNILNSFKAANSLIVSRRCIDMIGDHYLMCTYEKSPILNVWSMAKKDHLFSKMILPGIVNALTVSLCGTYCFAAIESKIYIWQISSGVLLNVLEKHYQQIHTIRVTSDLTRFISAGDDGFVLIWNFAKCVVESETFSVTAGSSNKFDPIKTINATISGKINDVYLSPIASGSNGGHFIVATEEGNCSFYNLDGKVLAKLLFDHPVKTVVMDRSERILFAGLANGEIRQCSINDWNSVTSRGTDLKVIDFTNMEVSSEDNSKTLIFKGHTAAITCLAVTIDGHGILSGSADQTIKLWHIKSGQCMRTTPFKGEINNLLVTSSPSALFIYESLESQQSLKEPASMVQTDVSLRKNCHFQENTNSNKQFSLFADHSKHKRPVTYDSIMRKAANPPPPIQIFKRDIYRPGNTKTTPDLKLDSFEIGSIWISNDVNSGSKFWPWKDSFIPSESDLNRIFKFEGEVSTSTSAIRESRLSFGSSSEREVNEVTRGAPFELSFHR